jgi:sugar lactone lactonase YvrE
MKRFLSLLIGCSLLAAAQVVVRVGPRAGDAQAAQEDSSPLGLVRGPILGYGFHAAQGTLRPLLGIPEASRWGDPIELPAAWSSFHPAPGHVVALAVERDTGGVLLVDLRARIVASPLGGARPSPDAVLWSPSGTTAALYYKDSSTVQILTGLAGAPTVAGAEAPAATALLAVADDGVAAAAGEASLWVLAPGEAPRYVAAPAAPRAAAFLPRSRDLILSDDAGNLLLARDLTTIVPLAGARDGLAQISAVAAAPDGRRVLVADAAARRLGAVPLDGAAPQWLDCDCAPAALDRLRGGAVFALASPSAEPLSLLDADGPAPRLLFVPAPAPPEEPGEPAPPRAPRARGVVP